MEKDKIVRGVPPEVEAGTPVQSEEPAAKPAPRLLREGGSKTVELEWPLEFDGVEYRTLTMRRLRGKDFENFRLFSAMGVDQTAIFMSLITSMPIEVVQAMDVDDYLDIVEKMRDFIPARFMEEPNGPSSKTGPNTPASSPTSSTSP